MQRPGKGKRLRSSVFDAEFDIDAVNLEDDRNFGPEGMWPQGAGSFIVAQFERRQREIITTAPRRHRPLAGANEAVLRQFANVAKLGKADRNAATDRHAAVEYGALGEKQVFAAIGCDPRQNLPAQPPDDGGRPRGPCRRKASRPLNSIVSMEGFTGYGALGTT